MPDALSSKPAQPTSSKLIWKSKRTKITTLSLTSIAQQELKLSAMLFAPQETLLKSSIKPQKIAQSCLFPTPTLANGLSSRQVARWISGKAPATFTSNSPGSRSRKSKMNILTPKLSLIRNAPKRSDFLLMKYAPPKKWCIFAGNRPRKTSSSSLNQECFIAFKKRFQRRTSSLAPPTIAPALIAAT